MLSFWGEDVMDSIRSWRPLALYRSQGVDWSMLFWISCSREVDSDGASNSSLVATNAQLGLFMLMTCMGNSKLSWIYSTAI